MKSKWVLVIITIFPVLIAYAVAILSLYSALKMTEEIINQKIYFIYEDKRNLQHTANMFQAQSLSSSFQNTLYKIDFINNFYFKVLEGKVIRNLNYVPAIMHIEALYQRQVDQQILEIYEKSQILTSNWQGDYQKQNLKNTNFKAKINRMPTSLLKKLYFLQHNFPKNIFPFTQLKIIFVFQIILSKKKCRLIMSFMQIFQSIKQILTAFLKHTSLIFYQIYYYFYYTRYDKNQILIENLSLQQQSLLRNVSSVDFLLHAFNLENLSSINVLISDFFFGYELNGMIYATSKNTTFSSLEKQPSQQNDKFNLDSRNRFWYTSAIDSDSLIINPPNLLYSDYGNPFFSLIFCKKLDLFNMTSQQIENYSVFCMALKLPIQINYFSSYQNNSNKTIYLIHPISQQVVYNSLKEEGSSQIETVDNQEFLCFQNNDEKQQFLANLTNAKERWISNEGYIDSPELKSFFTQLEKDSQILSYHNKGQFCDIMLSPIYFFQKDKFNKLFLTLTLIAIDIRYTSTQQLFDTSFSIQKYFDSLFVGLSIGLSFLCLFSVIMGIFFSLRFTKLFQQPIKQMKKMLIDIQLEDLTTITFSIYDQEYLDKIFFSHETKELFNSLECLFKMIKLTHESFFNNNLSQSLLQLYSQLQFFKNFNNHHAIGICHNNIGVKLLSMKDYQHALQHFQDSIIQSKYQIYNFNGNEQNSIQIHAVKKLGFTDQDVTNFSLLDVSEFKNYQKLETLYFQQRDSNTSNQQDQRGYSEGKKGFTDFCEKTPTNFIFKNFSSKVQASDQINEEGQVENKEIALIFQILIERKINYVIALIYLQEQQDSQRQQIKNANIFWEETKILIEELLLMIDYIDDSYSDGLKIFLLSFLPKCLINLNNHELAHEIIQFCKSIIYDMPNITTQCLQNETKPFSLTSQMEELYQKPNQIEEEVSSYLTFQKISNITNPTPKDQFQPINILKIPENNIQKRSGQGSSKFLESMNNLVNRSENKIGKNCKSEEIGIKQKEKNELSINHLCQVETKKKSKSFNLRKRVETKRQRQFDEIFKIEMFEKNQLNCQVQMSLAEVLIAEGDILSSAHILTTLLEETPQFLCSVPFQIAYTLNKCFHLLELEESEDLQKLVSKFNPEISLNVFMIFCPLSDNKSISMSIHILSALISEVLIHEFDLFGVLIVSQSNQINKSKNNKEDDKNQDQAFQNYKNSEFKEKYEANFDQQSKLFSSYKNFSLNDYLSISKVRSIWNQRNYIVEDIQQKISSLQVNELLRMDSFFSTRQNQNKDENYDVAYTSKHDMSLTSKTDIYTQRDEGLLQNQIELSLLQRQMSSKMNLFLTQGDNFLENQQTPTQYNQSLSQIPFDFKNQQQYSQNNLQSQSNSMNNFPFLSDNNRQESLTSYSKKISIKQRKNMIQQYVKKLKVQPNPGHQLQNLSSLLTNYHNPSNQSLPYESTIQTNQNMGSSSHAFSDKYSRLKFQKKFSLFNNPQTTPFLPSEQDSQNVSMLQSPQLMLDQISFSPSLIKKQISLIGYRQQPSSFLFSSKLKEQKQSSQQIQQQNNPMYETSIPSLLPNYSIENIDSPINVPTEQIEKIDDIEHLNNYLFNSYHFMNNKEISINCNTQQEEENKEEHQKQFQVHTHEGDNLIPSLNNLEDLYSHEPCNNNNSNDRNLILSDHEEVVRKYFFHLCIFRALSQMLIVHAPYSIPNLRFQKKNSENKLLNSIEDHKFKVQNDSNTHLHPNNQIKILIYSIDQIHLKQDNLLWSLCNLLASSKVQLLIVASQKSSCELFINKDILYFKGVEVIRIFYSSRKLINYISNLRDKFSSLLYPCYVQHY